MCDAADCTWPLRHRPRPLYLRRQDRMRAMERVRDLHWGVAVFPPSAEMPPTGFEPVLQP
jgi:hypothetical protein